MTLGQKRLSTTGVLYRHITYSYLYVYSYILVFVDYYPKVINKRGIPLYLHSTVYYIITVSFELVYSLLIYECKLSLKIAYELCQVLYTSMQYSQISLLALSHSYLCKGKWDRSVLINKRKSLR